MLPRLGRVEITRSRVPGPNRGGPPGASGVAVEQARDRAVVEDLLDRAGHQRRDRENGELVEATLLRDGQRVGDDDLGDAAVLEAVDGGTREDSMGSGH